MERKDKVIHQSRQKPMGVVAAELAVHEGVGWPNLSWLRRRNMLVDECLVSLVEEGGIAGITATRKE